MKGHSFGRQIDMVEDRPEKFEDLRPDTKNSVEDEGNEEEISLEDRPEKSINRNRKTGTLPISRSAQACHDLSDTKSSVDEDNEDEISLGFESLRKFRQVIEDLSDDGRANDFETFKEVTKSEEFLKALFQILTGSENGNFHKEILYLNIATTNFNGQPELNEIKDIFEERLEQTDATWINTTDLKHILTDKGDMIEKLFNFIVLQKHGLWTGYIHFLIVFFSKRYIQFIL